jgi:hypothetical protein
MRTQTEMPPLKLAEFKARNGYLEQGSGETWERIVQSEMTLRGRATRTISTRVMMAGVILSSISAITLVLAEIYRHLDGAITGQVQAATSLQIYLIAGIIAGLALGFPGRFLPGDARSRSRLAHRHH